MSSIADLFDLVARRYLELNSLSFDLDHLSVGAHIVANRRSGEVPYIYSGADRALPQLQKWPDRIESGVFHDQDHNGGRQHLRQHRVFELIGEMLRQHTQRERSLRSQRYLAHSVVSHAS